MSMPRAAEIADAIAAALVAVWVPVAPDSVTRVYGHEVDLESEDLIGRQVFVLPFKYGIKELWTRGVPGASDLASRTMTVLIAERYTDPGPVPRAWIDERAFWVENVVFLALDNPRNDPTLQNVVPYSSEVDPIADEAYLRQHNVFLSVVTIEFVEEV